MDTFYTDRKNTLLLISLLKAHGIKKIVASPGTSNMPFVASVQQDSFFEVYSSIDERSAAYIACGLAAESNEPVVISCTGATASRNYMPGLTEAFYRKLPVLAITASQDVSRIGQNAPQLIDRRVIPNDVAKMSIHLPDIHTAQEEKDYTVLINKAILELTRDGGGPVHINLTIADGLKKYNVKELPSVEKINRINYFDQFPDLPNGKIGIYVGAHKRWDQRLINAVEIFCEKTNCVVLVDSISNYRGKYAVFSNIVTYQGKKTRELTNFELLIHIGDIVGSDFKGFSFNQVWRINEDGEIRSTFGKLKYVFEMPEYAFFEYYNGCTKEEKGENSILEWRKEIDKLRYKFSTKDIPFSNIWIAQNTFGKLPHNAVIHFAIQNSLRCWNFFEGPKEVDGFCNTGGFGIDGNLSALIGASLVDKDKIYYGIIGDLAFFYDLNSLGNRHIGKNIRILLVNNNGGQQFRNNNSSGKQFGKEVNTYMAAAGHYGNQSKELVKNYATDLGFLYISASSKEEYIDKLPIFLDKDSNKQSIIFEVFLSEEEETKAMDLITHIETTTMHKGKVLASNILGEKRVDSLINKIQR